MAQSLSAASIEAAVEGERRRIERDLHDGAQLHLLTAGLLLGLLRDRTDDVAVRELIDETELVLRSALRDLRDLTHGTHPAVLSEQGLRPALDALARLCPQPVSIDADVGRVPARVERTAYLVASEALQNVVQHASATAVTVSVRLVGDDLALVVHDDGIGGACLAGAGLRGVADRVAALNGHLELCSPVGGGTTLSVRLPCG
jgi:signal transduction histidine kinase